jgi:hypothetical protein
MNIKKYRPAEGGLTVWGNPFNIDISGENVNAEPLPILLDEVARTLEQAAREGHPLVMLRERFESRGRL